MKTTALRKAFLNYFKEREHEIVPSSSLVPANDPTLLFTNAGMVQFKDVFLGIEKRSSLRATSSQRCVRAGGKHNDLENVGYTARHHTFFEMLGNFSFGDYFKREAIQYAWEFLTKVLGLPEEKLWVTIYLDDEEAADIWLKEIGVDPKRFARCGEKDNFWSMGDTGPCGPCSEIFYDHGPDIPGEPPGSGDEEGDRYVEIWNLVFMQYNRAASGELAPLPKPSVDTGMGLERIAAVMQGVHNNYDIDLFQTLIKAAMKLTGCKDKQHNSLKVIADHIRSCAFLINDGVLPQNEGRGYVLRRIVRRAVRHGNKLGIDKPFFYKLVKPLVKEMGAAYPELKKAQAKIEKTLLREEEQFEQTLSQGLKILEQGIAGITTKEIPGELIFKLYDTYGFPADLTGDIARERGFTLDMSGFESAMGEQRQRSQSASQFIVDYGEPQYIGVETDFTGYEKLSHPAQVNALLHEGKQVETLNTGEQGAVVLEHTPFYAESGGQVGDKGYLKFSDGVFEVFDTKKHGDAHLHYGMLQQGTLTIGMEVEAAVDVVARRAIMLNHSATHLLHAALRHVLGDQVIQKGSLVEAGRLRFDFAYEKPLTMEQIHHAERLVNQEIRANHHALIEKMTPREAQGTGALALFGEKYGDEVRVLSFGEFSKELCGGTHVEYTGDIGFFKITAETGIAAGVRRIEAITGDAAIQWAESLETQWLHLADLIKTQPDNLTAKVEQVLQRQRELEKKLEQLQAKLASSVGSDLVSQAKVINGIQVLAVKLENVEPKTLRSTLDQLKNKLGTAVVVLVGVNDDKINVVAGISKDCIAKVPAPRDLVSHICGKGGGRDDLAQGGGALPTDLAERLEHIHEMVKNFKSG